ncbi:MAG: hypothetical protein AB1599_02825 [Planctomycetota bacterium]
MDKNRSKSHIRVFIPAVNEYPREKAENWAKKYEQGLRHTLAQQRKAVPNQKAFFEKIARPILEGSKYWVSPEVSGVISQKGRTGKEIYERMEAKLFSRKTAWKYFRNTNLAYKTRDGIEAKKIKDWLPYAAAYYAIEMTFGAWRYLGSINDTGEGAFVLASEWLTGRMDCLNFFRDQDERLQGHPVLITAPERASEFRRGLRNKLARAVMILDIFNCSANAVSEQNDQINEFVNGFIRTEIMPFKTDGNSHINFTVLPETARLRDCRELRELRYRLCRHFLDETVSNKQLVPPLYENRIIPSLVHTLIGHPDYPVCVDMYLDIKVAPR